MSQDIDHIEELFRSTLTNAETPVDANIWSSIQSKIATNSVSSNIAAKKGFSTLTKGIILSSSIIGIGAISYLIYNQLSDNKLINTSKNINITPLNVVDSTNSATELITELKLDSSIIELPKSINKVVIPKTNSSSINKNISIEKTDLIAVIEPIKSNIIKEIVVEKPKESVTEKPVTKSTVVVKEDNSHLQNKEILEAKKSEFITLPNIYSLYNSGYFSVDYKGNFKDYSITILDDKQNIIFSTQNPDFKWYGDDLSGNKVEIGNYIYLIIAVDEYNNSIKKYQSLSIIH